MGKFSLSQHLPQARDKYNIWMGFLNSYLHNPIANTFLLLSISSTVYTDVSHWESSNSLIGDTRKGERESELSASSYPCPENSIQTLHLECLALTADWLLNSLLTSLPKHMQGKLWPSILKAYPIVHPKNWNSSSNLASCGSFSFFLGRPQLPFREICCWWFF